MLRLSQRYAAWRFDRAGRFRYHILDNEYCLVEFKTSLDFNMKDYM